MAAPVAPSAGPHPFPSSVMPSDDEISPARRLVTVRKITSIEPFNNAHNIINIDGWTVAVKKGESFKPGEYVLFFEVDAFLPSTSRFAALFQAALGQTTGLNGQEGYRIGTRDIMNHKLPMKNMVSQGLVFKLARFPQLNKDVQKRRAALQPNEDFADIMRQVDYSSHFGVVKWESQRDPVTGNWHILSFIKRTDTERVQNCPNLFIKAKYRNFVFQESVKLDGRSMTCYFVQRGCHIYPTLHTLGPDYEKRSVQPNGRFGVCSKSCELSNRVPNPYWETALELRLPEIMSHANLSIAIQGELVGWDLQGNPYNYPKNKRDFFVYSVTDVETRERWDPKDVKSFADDLGLKHVEVLGYTTLPSIARSHKDLLDRADQRDDEGLVFKCLDDNRWFKVLSNKYILKKGDEARAFAEEKARAGVKNTNDTTHTTAATHHAVGQRPQTVAHHYKQPVAETRHVAAPPNNIDTASTQSGSSQIPMTSAPHHMQRGTTEYFDALARAFDRALAEKNISFEEAAGLIPKAPKEETVEPEKKTHTQTNTSVIVAIPRALEKASISFEEAAGLIPKTPKEAAVVKTSQQSENKTSCVSITAYAPIKEEASAVQTSKRQDTPSIRSCDTSYHAADYTEAQPITAAADIHTEIAAPDPVCHKTKVLSSVTYDAETTSTINTITSQPIAEALHTRAQPITAAANTDTKTAAPEPGSYKTNGTSSLHSRAETTSTATHTTSQPIEAASQAKTVAHEPGYYNMDKANFDHFTQTCFAAESADASNDWLDTWSSKYLQEHRKPLVFDSAGDIVNTTLSPAENQTPAQANGSRWTNSRLRRNTVVATPAAAETKEDVATDTPPVAEKTRSVKATIDMSFPEQLTDKNVQVYTTIKRSVNLTTRDVDGRLVRVKMTVTTRTVEESGPANVPRGLASPASGTTATPSGTSTASSSSSFNTMRPAIRSGCPTPVVAAPTPGATGAPATSSGVPLIVSGLTSRSQDPADATTGPSSVVPRLATRLQGPAPVTGGLSVISAGPSVVTQGVAVPMTAHTTSTMSHAVPPATAAPLPIGGEQTMSGRYRGFADWLGIGPGGGVDDVRQQ
ncbi:hypothetical protein QBC39DRAFT_350251 [Podospora conica]|nr:hypothetical protein QBC39DRAFT_350251 [Schizothecium conicum]